MFIKIGSSDFPVGKPPKPVSAPTPTLPRMKDKKTYVGGRDSVSTIMISEFLSPSPSHACPSVYGIRGRVGVGGDTVANRLTHKKVGRTYNLKRDGFIETKKRKIKISESGITEYIRTTIDDTDKLPDGTDCVVVFDVPEKNRKIRKLLNKLLIELAFLKIQKSVWISQFDNAKLLKKLLIMLKIKKWVRIYTGQEE